MSDTKSCGRWMRAVAQHGLPGPSPAMTKEKLARFHRLVAAGSPQKPVPDVVTTGLDPVVHAERRHGHRRVTPKARPGRRHHRLDPMVHVERRRGERRVSARYSPKDARLRAVGMDWRVKPGNDEGEACLAFVSSSSPSLRLRLAAAACAASPLNAASAPARPPRLPRPEASAVLRCSRQRQVRRCAPRRR
jgi:hypothetical protein